MAGRLEDRADLGLGNLRHAPPACADAKAERSVISRMEFTSLLEPVDRSDAIAWCPFIQRW
jgi:hypothetical protein